MKTRFCWTFCLAAAVLIATAPQSPAQEDNPLLGKRDTAQQNERTRADLLAARQAAQSRPPGPSPSDPASNQQPQHIPGYLPGRDPGPEFYPNNQRQLFSPLNSTALAASPYPGFDPQLARINNSANQAIVELVKKIKEAESEEIKLELKSEVKQLLDEQYDAYLTHHEAPLKKLEERLEKLRAEFESRKKAKDDLVKLRLDTIWYDAMGLGWPDNRQSAFGFPAWRQPSLAVPVANPNRGGPPSILAPPTLPPVGGDPYSEPPARFKTER